jgi:drug/metabolite transporter (DMT)-like permease
MMIGPKSQQLHRGLTKQGAIHTMRVPLGLETREQKAIFITYISLWVSYGLLNELAKRKNVHFNSASAVILQSIIKLMIASYMFLTQEAMEKSRKLLPRIKYLLSQIQENRDMALKYFIPSGLYALYDILAYVNLRKFDASTYFLLLQFRMVMIGLLHQSMFKKKLNRNQWISIVITTLGCAIKTMGAASEKKKHLSSSTSTAPTDSNFHPVGPSLFAYSFLFIQLLSSTFAGVYNEVLLKKQVKMSLNLQNLFMYLDTIVCIFVILAMGLTGQSFFEAIQYENISILFSFYVFPMVLIMSFIGVVTSMFLKVLDSIRKAIASALELVFLPVLCAILFGMPINSFLVISVVFVASGVYIYSRPVEDRKNNYLPVSMDPNKDDDAKIEEEEEEDDDRGTELKLSSSTKTITKEKKRSVSS